MQDDIVALKSGQAPAGFKIEKQSEKESKTAVEPPVTKPLPQPQISAHIELGKLEKSRSFAGIGAPAPSSSASSSKTPSPPALSSQPSGLGTIKPPINISSATSFFGRLADAGSSIGSGKLIWGGVGLLVAVALVVLVVVSRNLSQDEVPLSPTPTPTATISISPIQSFAPIIENSFGIFSRVELGIGSDIYARLVSTVNTEALAGGEVGLYKIVDPQNGSTYSFTSFTSGAMVTVPEEINPFIDTIGGFYLSLMREADGTYSYGFIAKLGNDLAISQVLGRWETNMLANLQNLFGLDVSKAASVDFLDNSYKGVTIRYRNFPDPLKTMDYAIATLPNGERYLIFTNSRAHIYSTIVNLLR